MLLQIDITNRCNLKCNHCRAKKDSSELSLEDIKKICENAKKNQFKEITLSGGEPTLHNNFLEILDIIKYHGFGCNLTTNGLISKKIIKNEKLRYIKSIQISIDGTEKIHDNTRGIPGSFKRTIENARILKDRGFNIIIKSIIFKSNYNSIVPLAEYLKNEGFKILEIRMIIPYNKGRSIWELEKIDPKAYLKLFYKLKNIKGLKVISSDPVLIPFTPELVKLLTKEGNILNGKIYAGCHAGLDQLYISSDRQVFPCPYLPIKLGNIAQDFGKIMNSETFKRIGSRVNLKGKCSSCKNKFICGGCRAYPYLLKNDLMGEDFHCPIY